MTYLLPTLVESYSGAVNLWVLVCTIENVYPDLMCAVHLETSRQFVASIFGIPLVVGLLSNLQPL